MYNEIAQQKKTMINYHGSSRKKSDFLRGKFVCGFAKVPFSRENLSDNFSNCGVNGRASCDCNACSIKTSDCIFIC